MILHVNVTLLLIFLKKYFYFILLKHLNSINRKTNLSALDYEKFYHICSLLQDSDNLILNVSVRNVIDLNYEQFNGQIAHERLTSWLILISVAEIDLKCNFVRNMTVCIASVRRHCCTLGHNIVQ